VHTFDVGACNSLVNSSLLERVHTRLNVVVATAHEPSSRDSQLFHEARRALSLYGTSSADVLLIADCARERAAVAFSAFDMTFGCARDTVVRRMSAVDALDDDERFSVKLAHVIGSLDEWQTTQQCRRPSDVFVGSVVVVLVFTLPALWESCRRRRRR
jgi:hypothetical protein